MTKYEVVLTAAVCHTVEIEAPTEEEAIEAALAGDLPHSCHQCPQVEEWEFLPDIDNRAKREDFITELEEDAA